VQTKVYIQGQLSLDILKYVEMTLFSSLLGLLGQVGDSQKQWRFEGHSEGQLVVHLGW
jgi:hypothetical protein